MTYPITKLATLQLLFTKTSCFQTVSVSIRKKYDTKTHPISFRVRISFQQKIIIHKSRSLEGRKSGKGFLICKIGTTFQNDCQYNTKKTWGVTSQGHTKVNSVYQ